MQRVCRNTEMWLLLSKSTHASIARHIKYQIKSRNEFVVENFLSFVTSFLSVIKKSAC